MIMKKLLKMTMKPSMTEWVEIHLAIIILPSKDALGLLVDMENKDPLHFLFLILNDSILILILTCSNRYYVSKMLNDIILTFSRNKRWFPIKIDDLETYLLIIGNRII